MIDYTWLLAALSIIGAILNVRKNKWGFFLWIFANIGWIWASYTYQLYAQIPVWIIFLALSVWGFVDWHLKEKPYKLKVTIDEGTLEEWLDDSDIDIDSVEVNLDLETLEADK